MHDMYAQHQLADDIITYILLPAIALTLFYIVWKARTYKADDPEPDTRPKPRVTRRADFLPLDRTDAGSASD